MPIPVSWIVAGVVMVAATAVVVYTMFTQETYRTSHRRERYPPPRERADTHPRMPADPPEEDICPICLEVLFGVPRHTLNCGHRLHRECYQNLQSQGFCSRCPVCRREL